MVFILAGQEDMIADFAGFAKSVLADRLEIFRLGSDNIDNGA
jgi:hypothetical protein